MDEQIERPLTFIRDRAQDHAEAKANRVYLEQFRKSKVAAQQARGFGALCSGLPMLRIQQGKGFVHIQGARVAFFLPGITHLRGHIFCYHTIALLKTEE